ncbi:hypothetical protein MA16_Dca009277 [Dendrobium catenatum]|uniref:Cystatin domain-containing protein n=1 Tax=Dendrobium catenatum TaxID=906689 RepID=A0A2I0WYY1_9ASPA|nr:hypothetical protein MA16_Dca009277 [Dendrobium catenatum]
MAFTHSILLLFSMVALFYLISITTAQVEPTTAPPTAAPTSRNGDDMEVIKDVKNNRDIQELGMFAIDKANLRNSSWWSISFIEVINATRWHKMKGFRYLLDINSTKKSKLEVQVIGSTFAYLYVDSGERTLQTWFFKAA